MKASKAFETFTAEAPEFQTIWMETAHKLDSVSKLDKKTEGLAYLAVLAAMRLESGIPFHTKMVKMHGATREEVISAVLIGLPAAGNCVVSALPSALNAYDE